MVCYEMPQFQCFLVPRREFGIRRRLSIFIAQGKTADELAVLASLFDLMRSNLALMALNTASDDIQPNLGNTGSATDRAEFFDSLIGPSSDLGL